MTLRETVKGWMPVIVAGGLLAIGGLVAIPLGGWDTVRLQSAVLPEQPIGQPYVGNRLSTAIDDVYLTDEHPNGYEELDPGETFLIVVATMESLRDDPQDPLGAGRFYSFTVPGVLELGRQVELADFWDRLARDGSGAPTLVRGIPETIVFVFRISDRLFADGEEVRIGITDARPERADIIAGTRWVNPRVVAEVPVVIRERR